MEVKFWKFVCLVLITIFAFYVINMVQATSTLSPSSTVPSISGPMAYNSANGAIYILGFDGNLKVVSDTTNNVIATVNTGIGYGAGHQLIYGDGKIFVSSGDAKSQGVPPTVTVISGSTNTVTATITSSHWWYPVGMAYDSGTGNLYLADRGNLGNVFGAVYVISGSSNTVTTSIQVGQYPQQLCYDSGAHEIFVANSGGNVTVISDSTNQVVATIPVGSYPYGIVYDSKMNEVFVYNENDQTVSVISDSSNTVVKTITGITGNTVNPINIAYNPNKNEIFAGYSVISDSSNTIVATLPSTVTDMIYDSGRGEILGSTSTGSTAVFSDSSSPSTSTNPTSSESATASPTPKVPEFSSAAIFAVATAMVAITVCVIAMKRKKSNEASF
jgi:YVTN family beta-propeller protein